MVNSVNVTMTVLSGLHLYPISITKPRFVDWEVLIH